MNRVMETKVVICKVCGKPLEIVDFGGTRDQIGAYIHPECANPLTAGKETSLPRPLSDLLKLSEDTIAYARRVLPGELEPDLTDQKRFAKYFVLLCFTHKVLKSTEAVTLLCQNGYGEDATIITRSIAEATINAGMIEYLEPDKGARRWGAYKIALQWRMYLRWNNLDPELASVTFTPESVKDHRDQFNDVLEDWFLRDRSSPEKKYDPGNIAKNWLTRRTETGRLGEEDIYEMARKLDGIEQQRLGLSKSDRYRTLLRTAYDLGSDYVHSNPLAVEGYATECSGGKLALQSLPSERLVWTSLWSAVDGLIQMLDLVNRLKPLQGRDEIPILRKRWSQLDQD